MCQMRTKMTIGFIEVSIIDNFNKNRAVVDLQDQSEWIQEKA